MINEDTKLTIKNLLSSPNQPKTQSTYRHNNTTPSNSLTRFAGAVSMFFGPAM